MSTWFYPVAWSLQLGFGLLLFAVAALLETLVLQAYLGQWWLAMSLAAALEALKILVIVGHRILLGQTLVRCPRTVRWAVFGFRGLLLGLSAACSLMFLAAEKSAFETARIALAEADAERRTSLLRRLDTNLASHLAQLTDARDARLAEIGASNDEGDPRVEHPLARASVNTLGAIFDQPPTVLAFVFYFALLLSLAVEPGIWVSFEQVTLAHLPVFEARYRADMFAASKAVETKLRAMLDDLTAGFESIIHEGVSACIGSQATLPQPSPSPAGCCTPSSRPKPGHAAG